MKYFLSFLILSASILITQAQRITAIQCGKFLDVRTGEILSNRVVLIEDNVVKSVADGRLIKYKADTTIDLSDYTVMPGLIDCHTHVLLQGDITSEDYDVQVLKESVPYRTIRTVNS